MDIEGRHYRFRLDAERMLAFINAYQTERQALGIGTMLYHVTPQQHVDALTTILGLNAGDGWRRIGDEGPNALWLRYLRPILAETRESAAALTSTLERHGLPGEFEPTFPTDPEPSSAPTPPSPPSPSPPPSWRLAFRVAVERLRNFLIQRIWIIVPLLAILPIALTILASQVCTTCGTTDHPHADPPVVPRQHLAHPPQTLPLDPANKPPDQRVQDAYKAAIDLTVMAVDQRQNDITPRELAEIYAGESDHVALPELFLAEMLNRWPLPPDRSIPLEGPKYRILQEYAVAAASIENNLPVDDFETMVEGPSETISLPRPIKTPSPSTNHASSLTAGWLRWTPYLAFLPLLAVLAWTLARLPRSLKAGLRNAVKGTTGTPTRLPLGILTDTSTRRPRRLARLLSQRDAFPGRRLDSERTVLATIARSGFPTLIMRPAMRTVDYVFLVARRHRHDHERDRVMRLIDALKRGGVPLFVYEYYPDPRTLRPLATSEDEHDKFGRKSVKLDIRALRELHGDARLVLVTDGRELVDFFTQRALPFMATLRAWPGRMLLTPTPIANWGLREMNLSEALDARIGRATEEGFHDLAQVFRPNPRALHRQALRQNKIVEQTAPSLAARVFNWLSIAEKIIRPDVIGPYPQDIAFDDPALTSDAEPPADFQKACVEAMRTWLGRSGFLWLAACAAYPQTRFNITLYLGLKLTFMTRSGSEPLYNERMLARLAILPWLRTGRMPQWLRNILVDALTPAARKHVLDAIDELLQGNATAGISPQRRIDLTIWRPENRALDIPPDAVMADMLITKRASLVPILEGERFRQVFRDVFIRTFVDRLTTIGIVAAWCLAAWWLWPSPQNVPHPLGSWLPLSILLVVTAFGLACFAGILFLRRARYRSRPPITVSAPTSEIPPALSDPYESRHADELSLTRDDPKQAEEEKAFALSEDPKRPERPPT